MSIYTISLNFLSNTKDNKLYFASILNVFCMPFSDKKVAIDKNKIMLERYIKQAENNHHVFSWLDMMAKEPTSFYEVDINLKDDICDEEICLLLASSIKHSKRVIVYDHNYWTKYIYNENSCTITYLTHNIIILDKDQAYNELNTKNNTTNNYKNSIVANNGGSISNSNNLNSNTIWTRLKIQWWPTITARFKIRKTPPPKK